MDANNSNYQATPLRPAGESDAAEVSALLDEEQELLWHLYHDATEPPGKVTEKADLENFILSHALNIRELAKTSVLLMENGRPYAVVLLARTALESMFNLVAAVEDRQFGPQRIAFEFEELAHKLEFLVAAGGWFTSRKPTPDELRSEAERVRKAYSVSPPKDRDERNQIDKIERIAARAGLTPYYDDDYRQLSLTVHANLAGIVNAAHGFLIRKAMIALCHATLMASHVLSGVYRMKKYDEELAAQHSQLEAFTKNQDFLPIPPQK